MADSIQDAIDVVLSLRTDRPDRQIIKAILDLQRRHQYDEEEERRIQEMEKLVTDWCDVSGGGKHGD